jgi:hypothetical protein
VPREFTRGVLSCYLLSNENTLFVAKLKDRHHALITFGRLEIHTAGALTGVPDEWHKEME